MFAEAHLYLGVALAGLVSFLSPCVLPLVPPYLGYLGGTTFEEMSNEKGLERAVWRRIVLASIFFVLGFTTVFIALGASASLIGQFIQTWRAELSIAAGIVIILFGLHFLGVLHIPILVRDTRYHHANEGASFAGAYVMGLAFAFGWTPCIGPILSAVLALAANEASLGAGVRLLAVYSLGLGIPFVLAAVAIRPFLSFMQRFRRYLGLMEKIMGVLLVLTGIAFLNVFDWFSIQAIGQWLIETFPGLARLEEMMTPERLQEDLRNLTPGG
ncbi:cytochrome c biogenesis CcdA family protein [Hyphomicrobium sp.]|uniref:cytochrome c biogenesis CcdA family protein n=1 Tax=Hyphomicrobium sp. TaxID=82 RepID=UPI002FE186C4